MEGPVMTTLLLKASLLNRSSSQEVDNQTSYASHYLDNDVTYLLWLIVPPVMLVLGFYGNVMTMVVMRGLRASESTACLSLYFTALAVSDLCLLCTLVCWYWPEYAFNTPVSYFHDLSCTVPFFLSFTTSMTSAWFLVAMTCQRLMSVIVPHRVGVVCTVRRGKVLTAVIVIVSCLVSSHVFFHYHVEYLDDDGYHICLSNDTNIVNIFGFLNLFLASAIPFLILIVANCVLIHRALQSMQMARKMTARDTKQTSSRSAQVSSMTTTLVLTSAAFLVLTLPMCFLDIYYEMIGYYDGEIEDESLNETLALVFTVSALLLICNSAINFYIYILSGRKFREETKKILKSMFRRSRRAV